MEQTSIIDAYINEYYNSYMNNNNNNYYPAEYKQYFCKYDNDILEVHCKNIFIHHIEISKYLIHIKQCGELLFLELEKEEKNNSSIVKRFIRNIKKKIFKKDKTKKLSELLNAIYEQLYTYLNKNNTIPERKLMEIMRKNPCMYNDKTFLGLYLMSKQTISIFDASTSSHSKFLQEIAKQTI